MEANGTAMGSSVLGEEKHVRGLGVRCTSTGWEDMIHALPLNWMGGHGFSLSHGAATQQHRRSREHSTLSSVVVR